MNKDDYCLIHSVLHDVMHLLDRSGFKVVVVVVVCLKTNNMEAWIYPDIIDSVDKEIDGKEVKQGLMKKLGSLRT